MAKWAQVSDFAIKLPHEPGELARLTEMLQAAEINLIGLWGYSGGGKDAASIYCVPENAAAFRAFAEKTKLEIKEGTTFYLTGANHVGALVKMLDKIAKSGVSLLGIQSIGFNGEFGCFVWANPGDWEKLKKIDA